MGLYLSHAGIGCAVSYLAWAAARLIADVLYGKRCRIAVPSRLPMRHWPCLINVGFVEAMQDRRTVMVVGGIRPPLVVEGG
jgi:hypothetical protein